METLASESFILNDADESSATLCISSPIEAAEYVEIMLRDILEALLFSVCIKKLTTGNETAVVFSGERKESFSKLQKHYFKKRIINLCMQSIN
jgi:hypothetical protein